MMIKTLYNEKEDGRVVRLMTCECGTVHSSEDTFGDFDCGCRRVYNAFGQELNPDYLMGDGETEPYWEEGEFLATAKNMAGRV
jgi:hypothetical protein